MLFGLLAFCGIIGSDEAGGASPTTRRSLFVFIRNFVGGMAGRGCDREMQFVLSFSSCIRFVVCPSGIRYSYERELSSRFFYGGMTAVFRLTAFCVIIRTG